MRRETVLAVVVSLGAFVACDGQPKEPPPSKTSERPVAEAAGAVKSQDAKVEVIRPDAKPESADPPVEDPEHLVVAEPGEAYGQVLIQTRSDEDHIAELTIVRAEEVKARSGTLPYTAEPRILVAEGAMDLDESDLMGSGLALDIDGDGKTSSKVRSKCDGAAAVLQLEPPTRLEPVTELSEAVARFDYGLEGSRLLARDHAGAVLYAPCNGDRVVLGFDPEAPLRMFSVASPAVFVVYRAEVDSIEAPDPFSLKSLSAGETGLDHELHSFREVSVEKGTAKFYAAHLVVFAIDAVAPLQHVVVTISGQKPEFATASINEVDEAGHRIRYGDGFRPFPE